MTGIPARVIETIRTRWHMLMLTLDSRAVAPFKAIMYACFFVGGFVSQFFSVPVATNSAPTLLREAWPILSMVCPLIVLAGVVLCKHESEQPKARVTSGYLLRFAGDLAMTLTLSAYISVVNHYTAYAIYVIGGLACCTTLLAVANMRKLIVLSHWSGFGREGA